MEMCIRDRDNADQAAAALVDNALQRFLQLFAGILWHAFEFALQILTDQLMERAAENIALPDFAGVTFEMCIRDSEIPSQRSSRR